MKKTTELQARLEARLAADSEIDLEALADELYALMLEELRLERERLGARYF